MIVRALDSDGDWEFGKGANDYKSNRDAVAQSISTRLKSFLNDCFFAANEGIDWFTLLGGKNELALSLAINTTILRTENVTNLVQVSASLDPDTREYFCQYTVDTLFGRVTGDVPISVTVFDLLTTEDGDGLITEDGDSITT